MNDVLKSLLETIGFCLFFVLFLYFIWWVSHYPIYFFGFSGIVMFLYAWGTFYTIRRMAK